MGSGTNRNLAAKHTKAKAQKIGLGQAEYTKSAYYAKPMSDEQALTVAIAGRSDVVMVQGCNVRRIEAATTERVTTITANERTTARTFITSKPLTMKRLLRSHF